MKLNNKREIIRSYYKVTNKADDFYRCTVHYGVYILFIHQQLHFLLNVEKF